MTQGPQNIFIIKDENWDTEKLVENLVNKIYAPSISISSCPKCALEKDIGLQLIIISSNLPKCEIHPEVGGKFYGIEFYKDILKRAKKYNNTPIVIQSFDINSPIGEENVRIHFHHQMDFIYKDNSKMKELLDFLRTHLYYVCSH